MQAVYGLGDPLTGEIRYVGYSKDVIARYKGHIAGVKKHFPVARRIKSLKDKGLKPILYPIKATLDAGEERRIIKDLRDKGHRLLNMQRGGPGGGFINDAKVKKLRELENSSK